MFATILKRWEVETDIEVDLAVVMWKLSEEAKTCFINLYYLFVIYFSSLPVDRILQYEL
jgi:hypothetical protein